MQRDAAVLIGAVIHCQKSSKKHEVGKKFSIMDRMDLFFTNPNPKVTYNDIVIKLIVIKKEIISISLKDII